MIRRPSSRRAAALGLALAAAVALAWTGGRALRAARRDPRPPWPDPPILRMEPGAERAYAFEVRSEVRLDGGGSSAAQREAFSLEARGLLVLRPYPSDGDTQEVGARVVSARLIVAGQVPAYAAGLDAPFSFRLDRHGRFTRLKFGERLVPEAIALLQQLLVRLELVLPRESRATWRTRERDAAGIFRAAYAVAPDAPLAVEKRKLEYLPEEGGAPAPDVEQSRTTFELEPELHGIRRVEGAERLRRREGALEGRESFSFRYALTPSPDALPDTLSELVRLRDGARDPADGSASASREDLSSASSATQVLARFGDAFRTSRSAAEGLVSAWLRQADAPAELVRQLDAMNRAPERALLDAAQRSVLWRLLAQAGTPEAEATLLDAAGPTHPPLTRRQAIGHFGQVPVARMAMVDGLLGIYAEDRGRDRPGAEGLSAMALLAIGSLGHPSLAAPEVTRTVVGSLEARLAGAADTAERETALAAMGNVGEPCLPALRRSLDDPDPVLRAAAASAFRRMEGAEGRRALLDHFAVETEPAVRARVVEVLQRLAPDRHVIAWAAGEVSREPDRRVLMALVDLLGSAGVSSPAARAALQGLLRTVDDRTVKMQVLRYVPPEQRLRDD